MADSTMTLRFSVRTLGGESYELVEPETAKVGDVKKRLAHRMGLQHGAVIKLLLWGSELDNESTLYDSKVRNTDTLHMLIPEQVAASSQALRKVKMQQHEQEAAQQARERLKAEKDAEQREQRQSAESQQRQDALRADLMHVNLSSRPLEKSLDCLQRN